MRDFNNHHCFFEKSEFRRTGGGAKKLMHLTTVLVPIREVHRIIHTELKPMPVPGYDLANHMLTAARSVSERGIERLEAIILALDDLSPDSHDYEDSRFYYDHLLAQRQIMGSAYPMEE